jgi:anti-anti-sigma factor
MDTDDLTITTIRDGAACTLIVSGELCYSSASGFLQYAARVVDDRIEQFVLDLAGVTFLDCTGLRALALVTGFAPGSCPVILRSLSPAVHRIFALLDLDPEKIRDLIADRPGTRGLAARSGDRSGRTWPGGGGRLGP